ncbi:acetoacetate--CoA ligase [soil metagenome]
MESPSSAAAQGELLWKPSSPGQTNLECYADWLETTRGLKFEDYPALWQWSVDEPEAFWSSIAEYFKVTFHQLANEALTSRTLPGAKWFPGATLNYAEHVFAQANDAGEPVLHYESEADANGEACRVSLTRAELATKVATVAATLRRHGIGKGDRVVGYLTNIPEAVIAFLAVASVGAIWSNCPAELSAHGVIDRFLQIEPKLLFAVEGYRYAGKPFDRRTIVQEIVSGLPTIAHVVLVPTFGFEATDLTLRTGTSVEHWNRLPEAGGPLIFEPVPFDHPLWILYSSGTTGAPKAIVHGHGGILLEHLKALSFHLDLRKGDRFFWFTTSGWMMWNFLISGLLLPGVAIVLYDGSPKHPNFGILWELVERFRVTYFGTSAPYLVACMKENLKPTPNRFPSLRAVGSTGAPLPAEGFGWVQQFTGANVSVGSISGGTDVCTAFVLSAPTLPVYAGELQCLGLGAKIESWDEDRCHAYGRVGELVLPLPFPSMPVFFWNDPDGSRFLASYFEKYAGVWCHGDWIEIQAPGTRCVIHGRSDSTLNRGGVRMGTAEFYSIVENIPEVAEALVIDTGGLGREDRLLLFLALHPGQELDDALRTKINQRLRSEISPRHVPDEIHAIPEIPHTLNGKKLEVPVKRLLTGSPLEKVAKPDAVANYESLRYFVELAAQYPPKP